MPRALYANHKWLPRAFNAAVSVQSPILKTGRAGRLSGHGCIRTPSRGSRTPHLAVTVSLANSLFTTTQELDHRLGIIGFTLVTGRSSGSQAPRDTAVANRRPFRIIIATSRVFLSHSQPPRGAGTDQPLRASVRDRARFFRRLTRLRRSQLGCSGDVCWPSGSTPVPHSRIDVPPAATSTCKKESWKLVCRIGRLS